MHSGIDNIVKTLPPEILELKDKKLWLLQKDKIPIAPAGHMLKGWTLTENHSTLDEVVAQIKESKLPNLSFALYIMNTDFRLIDVDPPKVNGKRIDHLAPEQEDLVRWLIDDKHHVRASSGGVGRHIIVNQTRGCRLSLIHI